MLTVLAPAKINLTLEVLAMRPDGFHEIRSVIQTINLCDSICLQLNRSIEFRCDEPSWIPEESLLSRAVELLQKTTGCTEGASIEIDKRIPLISGLGGDSSGAAAILRGLDKFWGLGLSQKELLELAGQLGSDVGFLLYGGTALVEGRGEVVTPLPSLPHIWVVLLVPPVSRAKGKTGRLYASLKTEHYTRAQITNRLVGLLTGGGGAIPPLQFNVFDGVAFDNFTGLEKYWQRFSEAGAQEIHMAGSGPALFTLVKDEAEAEKIYGILRKQGLESYLTETSEAIEPLE